MTKHNLEDVPETITAKEIGSRLGVSSKTILRWSEDGKIPKGFRLDRRVLWNRAKMERFIQERLSE